MRRQKPTIEMIFMGGPWYVAGVVLRWGRPVQIDVHGSAPWCRLYIPRSPSGGGGGPNTAAPPRGLLDVDAAPPTALHLRTLAPGATRLDLAGDTLVGVISLSSSTATIQLLQGGPLHLRRLPPAWPAPHGALASHRHDERVCHDGRERHQSGGCLLCGDHAVLLACLRGPWTSVCACATILRRRVAGWSMLRLAGEGRWCEFPLQKGSHMAEHPLFRAEGRPAERTRNRVSSCFRRCNKE